MAALAQIRVITERADGLGEVPAAPALFAARLVHCDSKIPVAGFWGAAGYVCSLLLIYYAGWSTMINVMTVTLLGLPIYSSYASVKHGWSKNAPNGNRSASRYPDS